MRSNDHGARRPRRDARAWRLSSSRALGLVRRLDACCGVVRRVLRAGRTLAAGVCGLCGRACARPHSLGAHGPRRTAVTTRAPRAAPTWRPMRWWVPSPMWGSAALGHVGLRASLRATRPASLRATRRSVARSWLRLRATRRARRARAVTRAQLRCDMWRARLRGCGVWAGGPRRAGRAGVAWAALRARCGAPLYAARPGPSGLPAADGRLTRVWGWLWPWQFKMMRQPDSQWQ